MGLIFGGGEGNRTLVLFAIQ